ncbi:MAG: carboxypeptidase regulatory-like domain-containing protein [Bryobacteraceae bacterium]|nr:carboxypeptidase regulatory-like domain-containing protein [Bryobacteraceae bacterium]
MSLTAALLVVCLQGGEPAKPVSHLEGRVVSSVTGQPIARAKVTINADKVHASWLYTNAEGKFRFAGIPPGQYRVDVERNGYASDWASKIDGRTMGKLVVLEQDQTRDLVIKLLPHAVLGGQVVDEFGEPLANATVIAFRMKREYGKVKHEPTIFVITNDLGEYRLAGLLPGKYLVMADRRYVFTDTSTVEAADPEERKFAYVPTFYPSALQPELATPVEVRAAAQLGGINIPIQRARRLRVSGVLRAPEPERFNVTLNQTKDFTLNSQRYAQVKPDAQGRFTIERVLPGNYTLWAQEAGERPQLMGQLPLTLTTTDVENVSLTVGETPLVSGTLRFETEGATPAEYPAPVFYSADQRRRLEKEEFEAKEGTFQVKLPAGNYRVDTPKLPERAYLKQVLENGAERERGRLRIDGNTRLELVIGMNAATLAGSVADGAGARVVIWPVDEPELAVTVIADGYGRFRLGNLAPGSYRMLAFSEGETEELEDPELLAQLSREAEPVTLREGATEARSIKPRPRPEP